MLRQFQIQNIYGCEQVRSWTAPCQSRKHQYYAVWCDCCRCIGDSRVVPRWLRFRTRRHIAVQSGILKSDPRCWLTRAISRYSRGARATRRHCLETPPFIPDRDGSTADSSFPSCSRVYLRDRIRKQMAGPFFYLLLEL